MNKETKIILVVLLIVVSLYLYHNKTGTFSISENNKDVTTQQGIFLKEYCIKNGGVSEMNDNICKIQNIECDLNMFIFHKCPNQP